MKAVFRVTMLGNAHALAHERQLLHIIEQCFQCTKLIPVPGDLLMLPIERGVPPVVYHVNRRILSVVGEEQEWEIVVEEGTAGLFAGREVIRGVVQKMVRDASKKILREQDQIELITDTIYDAVKGKIIYG